MHFYRGNEKQTGHVEKDFEESRTTGSLRTTGPSIVYWRRDEYYSHALLPPLSSELPPKTTLQQLSSQEEPPEPCARYPIRLERTFVKQGCVRLSSYYFNILIGTCSCEGRIMFMRSFHRLSRCVGSSKIGDSILHIRQTRQQKKLEKAICLKT